MTSQQAAMQVVLYRGGLRKEHTDWTGRNYTGYLPHATSRAFTPCYLTCIYTMLPYVYLYHVTLRVFTLCYLTCYLHYVISRAFTPCFLTCIYTMLPHVYLHYATLRVIYTMLSHMHLTNKGS